MDEQKDFSFGYFFKYILRYALVLVLCAALGAAGGVYYTVNKLTTNREKYSGSLDLDAVRYTSLMAPAVPDDSPDKEFDLYSRQLNHTIEVACSPEVTSATFTALEDRLYPHMHNRADKIKEFNKNLSVSRWTDSITVSFVYDIRDEETDRTLARDVVSTFLANAKANVERNYPLFADQELISIREVERDYTFGDSSLDSDQNPSAILYGGIGAVAGLVVGAGLLFVAYFFDPRIKTVSDLLPSGKRAVVNADKDNAVNDLLAGLKYAEAKKLLIVAPVEDKALEAFADQLCDYLKTGEKKVNKVVFGAQDATWFRYFDDRADADFDYEIYLCQNTGAGVIGYIGKYADAAAVFADQKAVSGKKLKAAVESVKDCRYLCTVIHNAGRAYLD